MLDNVSIKKYIDSKMEKIEGEKIASADEVLQTLTKILRMEIYETTEEVNLVTGEIVELKNSPKLSDVNRAASELMKRYPTATETKKLTLEIEKLKQQTQGSDEQDDKISTYIKKLKDAIADE